MHITENATSIFFPDDGTLISASTLIRYKSRSIYIALSTSSVLPIIVKLVNLLCLSCDAATLYWNGEHHTFKLYTESDWNVSQNLDHNSCFT